MYMSAMWNPSENSKKICPLEEDAFTPEIMFVKIRSFYSSLNWHKMKGRIVQRVPSSLTQSITCLKFRQLKQYVK